MLADLEKGIALLHQLRASAAASQDAGTPGQRTPCGHGAHLHLLALQTATMLIVMPVAAAWLDVCRVLS